VDETKPSPSDVLMHVFDHASEAKAVAIILEEADGTIRFHCSTDSLYAQLGMTIFAFLGCAGQVLKGQWGE
jgi:hypothetical protein